MNYSQKIITASDQAKSSYKFKVSFLRMPENYSDFMGKRVKTVSYPSIGSDVVQHTRRRTTFPDQGRLTMGEVTIGFIPDATAVLDMILYTQLHRQRGVVSDAWENEAPYHNYKFDIQVQHFGTDNKLVKTDTFKNAFITNITYPELDTGMDDRMTPLMTVLFNYDAIEMDIVDFAIELSKD